MKWISKAMMLCMCMQSSHATSSWFLNAQAGGQSLNTPHEARVYNGSGFSSPYDQDRYTATHTSRNTLLGIQAGYRCEAVPTWLSAYSLGLQYQYFANTTVNGQIIQFSLPEFTNYDYTWHVASNVLLTQAKLNFKEVYHLSPYVNAGIGLGYQTSQYSETALPDVTPRISPNYGSHTTPQFTYVLGAGIDDRFNPVGILSAGYQYGMLGDLSSGPGNGPWSSQAIHFGTYHSYAFLLGLTYLFALS